MAFGQGSGVGEGPAAATKVPPGLPPPVPPFLCALPLIPIKVTFVNNSCLTVRIHFPSETQASKHLSSFKVDDAKNIQDAFELLSFTLFFE